MAYKPTKTSQNIMDKMRIEAKGGERERKKLRSISIHAKGKRNFMF
jgi:hypothetical protein